MLRKSVEFVKLFSVPVAGFSLILEEVWEVLYKLAGWMQIVPEEELVPGQVSREQLRR